MLDGPPALTFISKSLNLCDLQCSYMLNADITIFPTRLEIGINVVLNNY